jgi:hypothetical protein
MVILSSTLDNAPWQRAHVITIDQRHTNSLYLNIVVHDHLCVALYRTATTISSFSGAILNLIGILVLNVIYNKLAVVLTNWENHQKETDYEDALAVKFFLFGFANSYTSIFYIAFFRVCRDHLVL